MRCQRYRRYLNRNLSGAALRGRYEQLRENLPESYRTHLDSCRACRLFTISLQSSENPSTLKVAPPADLAAKAARAARSAEELPAEQPPGKSRIISIPRWARLAAAAILLVAASSGLTLFFTGTGGSETVVVHLHLKAPDAEKVSVVGDWNEWEPNANPLKDGNNDGVWETRIRVPRDGEYQYQFLINGEKWIPDPNAPLQVNDGFGGTNSVLDI